jgi:hypothetical protein
MSGSAIDWNWVTSAIDDLTLNYGDPFLQVGKVMHFWFGVLILIVYCWKWLTEGGFSLRGFTLFVGLFLISGWMLENYNRPLPWDSQNSFKTWIPSMATDLANTIENTRYDLFMNRVVDVASNLQKPTITIYSIDVWAIGMYWLVEIDMWILGAILLVPIALSFIAIGMGAIQFPLVIPCMMWPRLSHYFWSGLNYIIKYSFYRVWAAMLTFVWAGIMVQFLDHIILPDLPNHTYSLAQFTGMTPIVMILLNGACIYMVFYLPRMLQDFFGGGASAGSTFLPAVVNAGRLFA